jgi:hypothetical protein
VYDENIYNFCARARFAGCTYLRHIILGLNTVHPLMTATVRKALLGPSCSVFYTTEAIR